MSNGMEVIYWLAAGGGAVGAFVARLATHRSDKKRHDWNEQAIKQLQEHGSWVGDGVKAIAQRLGIDLTPQPNLSIKSPPPYATPLEEITKPGRGAH